MGYAKLNIWVRDVNCNLVEDCWRLDLVIQNCMGKPVTEMDTTIIPQLQARYPSMADPVSVLPNYQNYTRIHFRPGSISGPYINHVEVDVPPGCYVVWARVCHGKNEETNKAMVIARCDDHLCVNLLLNTVGTCNKDNIQPVMVGAVQQYIPNDRIKEYIRVVKQIGGLNLELLKQHVGERVIELGVDQGNNPTLAANYQALIPLLDELIAEQCC